MREIKLYGAEWCTKTSSLRNYLQSKWIDFSYYNVETDETAEKEVRNMFDGQLKFPVLTIDEEIYKNPNIALLNKILD